LSIKTRPDWKRMGKFWKKKILPGQTGSTFLTESVVGEWLREIRKTRGKRRLEKGSRERRG